MPARTAHPVRPIEVAPPRAVCVRWSAARSSLPGYRSTDFGDAVLELTAAPSPDGWVCRASILDGETATRLQSPPPDVLSGGWTSDAEAGLDHLDLPGFLHVTLRGDAVLYARTPLLAALGVPGGRYEIA